jgi:DNA-binding CsgD family transcriptional regulator
MPGLDASGVFGMQIFSLRRAQGRLRALTPVVRHFVKTTAESATWGPGLALIYAELGLRREARVEFEKLAAQDFAGIPRDGMWATCVVYLAQVCAFLNDDTRAPTLYRFLLPYDGHNILAGTTVACYGAAAHYLGLLAATMARWNEAEKHFEDTLAMNERTGAKPSLAHALFDYAAMLSKRGEPNDRAKTIGLLQQASALSAELDMRALAERIAARQQRLGVKTGIVAYPDGLTGREVEVLQLVATGKGNNEIGALLFISSNTVANHIRNILTKTKTSNRTEAAAYAASHGLLAS